MPALSSPSSLPSDASSAPLAQELAQALAQGIAALGLALPEGAEKKLLDYLLLLQKWNRTYNLTAIRDPEQMLTHHVLDALAVIPVLDRVLARMLTQPGVDGRQQTPPQILDVGSGGGIPGLILALARPGWQVTMLDAVQKKMAFVTQAIIELKLPNARAQAARIETFAPPVRYDLIVSRAFSELTVMVAGSRHVLAPQGVWAAMKGVYPEAEIAALPADIRVTSAEALTVPGLDAHRHLILLEPLHGA